MTNSESEPIINNPEQEARSHLVVWAAEDDSGYQKVLESAADINDQISLTVFESGSRFINKFETAAKERNLPDYILLDYNLHLSADNKYSTGLDVLEKLKAVVEEYELDMPNILAHSSDKDCAQKIIDAGASQVVKKPSGTIAFFRDPEGYE